MLKIFRNLRKGDVLCLGAALVFIVAQVWLDLKMPDYMSEITRLVQTPGNEMSQILAAGGKMLARAGKDDGAYVIIGVSPIQCINELVVHFHGIGVELFRAMKSDEKHIALQLILNSRI